VQPAGWERAPDGPLKEGALDGAEDITSLGGWRAYLARPRA
jgi:hypothetical protein